MGEENYSTFRPEPPPDPGSGSGDTTTRKCPDCGNPIHSGRHESCPSVSGALKRSPSARARLDDMPPEIQEIADDPSKQLNQYILLKQIGKGGMGAVWKAWDRKLTRWVAIKFLITGDEEDVLRFEREAKLAARLRHPNIAPIYEVGLAPSSMAGEESRHYLAMEYVDGETLGTVQLGEREAVDVFVKVAQGMEAAHKSGVVHRDIKPQNIMLTTDRWPYIMDFGLAKSLHRESSISVSGSVMGTPAYMSPEQAQGRLEDIDPRSDIFSLGATMYAFFTRRQPFNGKTQMEILMKACNSAPPPPREVMPDLPEPLERIILKTMAREPEDRYASAAELAADLKRYLDHQEVKARIAPARSGAGKATLLVGALLVVGAILAWVLWPAPPPVSPGPPPDVSDAARQWLEGWRALRAELDFETWKPGDAGLPGRAGDHLERMAANAPAWSGDVVDWFTLQLDKAEVAVGTLNGTDEKDRAAAIRASSWCGAMGTLAGRSPALAGASDRAAKLRASAMAVASYRGSFTLKILVGPYAKVTRLERDGKPVAIAQAFTPVVVPDLEIGDYALDLVHPELGKKTVRIAADRVGDGKVYLVSGSMGGGPLRVSELPR